MFTQVVVLTYQSPEIDSYTYLVPKELEKEIKVGQLVEVPFGKRQPYGIVIAINHQLLAISDKTKIKPISKILIYQPLLLQYQIDLAQWMKDYYLAPMVNCLNTMLPEIPKRAVKQTGDLKARSFSFPRLQTEGLSARRPGLVRQSLILVPSINKIAETMAKFPKAKNYVVYHNELKDSEKFSTWQKIISGEVDYIFGSRSAIFTPCPNLKEIIIYDEHDGAYKDERSPYYDTLTVAQKNSELTGAQIKIVDPSPKITTYHQLKNHIKIQKFAQKAKVVDIQKERLSGSRSPISFDLEEEIRQNLENKGNILLFLNKKKESGHIFCKSCKNSEFQEKQPNFCPNCKSPDIFWNVLNINSLAIDAKKLFPNSQINLIADHQPRTINHEPSTIDIGTSYSLYSPLAKKYNLISHIQTDSLINVADFSSGEKLFAQITSLKKLLNPNGKLILQTYNADNPAIELATQSDYPAFFQAESEQRKSLNYPPFGLLIKLTIKGKSDEKIKRESEQLAAHLQSTIYQLPATILGPYQSIFWQKKPTYHIILKYKLVSYSLKNRQESITGIKGLLSPLPKGWQTEVEPDSIQ